MIRFQPFSGYTYSKAPTYADLVTNVLVTPIGCVTHDLGVCSDGVNHVYAHSYGDLTTKPVIFFEGAIHGAHEWRSVYYVQRFIEIIANPTGHPNRAAIEKLRSKFSFFVIPCLNPYGYENSVYTNANGVNLNRNFDNNWSTADNGADGTKGTAPFSEPETKMVRDAVLSYKPVLFIDWHTQGGFMGLESNNSMSNDKRMDIFLTHLANAYQFNVQPSVLRVPPAGNSSLSHHWVNKQDSKNGFKTIAVVAESGSLETEAEQMRLALNFMFLASLFVSKWFENRVQNI